MEQLSSDSTEDNNKKRNQTELDKGLGDARDKGRSKDAAPAHTK